MLQHLLKITVHVLLAGLLNGWVTNARAERSETAVWQIGQPDGNYAELALAGRYADFNAAFTQGVHFEVGHSKPEADWPYIQPGPTDTWAGSKEHPFEIGFDLAQAPGTLYRLEIDAVDAQASYPPAVTVLVNGRELDTMAFRPGVGDASHQTQPAKPASGERVDSGRLAHGRAQHAHADYARRLVDPL